MPGAGLTTAKPRVIVSGFIGLLQAGGVTWDYLQYPLAMAQMGYDVFYLEDTGLWPIYQEGNAEGSDASSNVKHLASVMDAFGLAERWAYRDVVTDQVFGLSHARLRDILQTADVLINVSCSLMMRDEYLRIPVRMLLDSDPMFTQMQYMTEAAFTSGKSQMRELMHAHTDHFTFGELVGHRGCKVPACGVNWQATRQPICLEHWPVTRLPEGTDAAYTTVMNWSAAPPLEYDGQQWGQKDTEFLRIASLPQEVPSIALAVAVGHTTGSGFPAQQMQQLGWRILKPQQVVPDWQSYRAFIQASRGEFSIAKETYVKARTGWFSCRSACYLAAGRPVITQETGWSERIPAGEGLLAFEDQPGAAEALRQVESDPQRHARAARQIAEEFFDSRKVIGQIFDRLGSRPR